MNLSRLFQGEKKKEVTISPNYKGTPFTTTLVRSAAEEHEYSEWISSLEHRLLKEDFGKELDLYTTRKTNSKNFARIEEQKASGFYYNFKPNLSKETSVFFLEFVKEGILDLNYFQRDSHRKIQEIGKNFKIEEGYEFYPVSIGDESKDPIYGRVKVSLTILNGSPLFIKIMASEIEEINYIPNKPLIELIQKCVLNS